MISLLDKLAVALGDQLLDRFGQARRVFPQKLKNLLVRLANHRRVQGLFVRHTPASQQRAQRLVVDRLGVDQHPVHVEDHRFAALVGSDRIVGRPQPVVVGAANHAVSCTLGRHSWRSGGERGPHLRNRFIAGLQRWARD
jgi:hypothetical protein